MTQEQTDALRGMNLARRAMIAKSEGDDSQVLAVLNEAQTMGEAGYAAATMLAALWDATLYINHGNTGPAAAGLRRAAQSIADEHAVLHQVALIVRDAERGEGDA